MIKIKIENSGLYTNGVSLIHRVMLTEDNYLHYSENIDQITRIWNDYLTAYINRKMYYITLQKLLYNPNPRYITFLFHRNGVVSNNFLTISIKTIHRDWCNL